MTVSGVPAGARDEEEEKSLEMRNTRRRAEQATIAPNWIFFRRTVLALDGRAYGGGCEVFRGGKANCISAQQLALGPGPLLSVSKIGGLMTFSNVQVPNAKAIVKSIGRFR